MIRPAVPALLFLLLLLPYGGAEGLVSVRAVHPPIRITADSDFERPGSGVVSGSGSAEDPYLILGWEILPPPRGLRHSAIEILGTSAHVRIEDVVIRSLPGGASGGILVRDAANVSIVGSLVESSVGVSLKKTSRILITSSTFLGTAASIVESREIIFQDSQVDCRPRSLLPGVEVVDSTDVAIRSNNLTCSDGPAVRSQNVETLALLENRVDSSADAIVVRNSTKSLVDGNILTKNRGYGLYLIDAREFVVQENTIQDGNSGIVIGLAYGLQGPSVVSDNVVERTEHGFFTEGFPSPYPVTYHNNLINGRPLLLFTGARDQVIDGTGKDIAYLILADAERVRVQNWQIESATEHPMVLVHVRDSIVSNNQFLNGGGLLLAYGGANTVEINRFENVSGSAILVGSQGSLIRENSITSKNTGVSFRSVGSDWDSGEAPVGSQSRVTGNTIMTEGCPVCVYSTPNIAIDNNTLWGLAPYALSPTNLVFRDNNINAGYLKARRPAFSAEPMKIDAQLNWWGRPEGPVPHEVDGVEILDTPWLTQPFG